MERERTKTFQRREKFGAYARSESADELTAQRLEWLLAQNFVPARDNSLLGGEREEYQFRLMKNPLDTQTTFAYFGLMLGIFPPAAFFTRILLNARDFRFEDSWIFGLIAVVTLLTSIVGFFSGKYIGKIVREIEDYPWWSMILLLPFVGALWGIVAGGAGGAVILLFGAFFGAAIGGAVGAAALPVFAVFHRLLKIGDAIEFKHFLPAASAVVFSICAFILGL